MRGEAEGPGLLRLGSSLPARKLLRRQNQSFHGGAQHEDKKPEAEVETRVLLTWKENLSRLLVSQALKCVAQRGFAVSILGGIFCKSKFLISLKKMVKWPGGLFWP